MSAYKPMRDHVLLQAVARVNRPYVNKEGIQKKVGLVIDFSGVLRELKKALQFDSSDVDGVIEDLDLLMQHVPGRRSLEVSRANRPAQFSSSIHPH